MVALSILHKLLRASKTLFEKKKKKKKKNEQQKLWLFMSRLRLSLVDEAAQPQANE